MADKSSADTLFRQLSYAFRLTFDVILSHVTDAKETCDMRHRIRKYPTNVTSASTGYKRSITELLIIISVLQCRLQKELNKSAGKLNRIDLIVDYLQEAHHKLSIDKNWTAVTSEHIKKELLDQHWPSYMDFLRERSRHLEKMLQLLQECRPYVVVDAAWKAYTEIWAKVEADAEHGIRLKLILQKVNQLQTPQTSQP